jgi:hypothetical protein
MMLIGVIIHIFYVGIPISLTIRQYARSQHPFLSGNTSPGLDPGHSP